MGEEAHAQGWPRAHPRMVSAGQARRNPRSMDRHLGRRKQEDCPPRQKVLRSEEPVYLVMTQRKPAGSKERGAPDVQESDPNANRRGLSGSRASRQGTPRRIAEVVPQVAPQGSSEEERKRRSPTPRSSQADGDGDAFMGVGKMALNLSTVRKAPDQGSDKIHDSVDSFVQKRSARPHDNGDSYEQQQSPHLWERVRAPQRRGLDSRHGGSSPMRKDWPPGPQNVCMSSRSPVKHVAAAVQPTGLAPEASFDPREIDFPQRRWSFNVDGPQPCRSVASSPTPQRRDFNPVEPFGRRMEARLSDVAFDPLRTNPDILQTTDMMRSGEARWGDFLQSTDVCWDDSVHNVDQVYNPSVHTPWVDSRRSGGMHRPPVPGKQDTPIHNATTKDSSKQGPFKSFLGRMLGGCVRLGSTDNDPGQGAQSGQQRRLSVFPRQSPNRQCSKLGRFASRQRFMVNLIEEGRFHPTSSNLDAQKEIKE